MEITYRPELLEPRTNPPRSSPLQVPIAGTAIALMPGFNVVDSSLFEAALAHTAIGPNLKQWIEDGVIVPKAIPVENIAEVEPALSDYNLTDAVKRISNCQNPDLLAEWQAIDPRKGVQKAIADQLKRLEPEPA